MKKNLLILAFAAPLIAFGQKPAFLMGDGVSVKVKKQTLVYTNGEFKVKAGTTTAGSDNTNKFSNDGNVKVDGAFTTEDNGNQSTRFVNKFTSGSEYGQLIIQDGVAVNGEITAEYKFSSSDVFPYQEIAFPFYEYSAETAVKQSGILNPKFASGSDYSERYKNAMFKANNVHYRVDHIKNEDKGFELDPTVGYSINQLYSNLNLGGDLSKSFIGTPYHYKTRRIEGQVIINNTNDSKNIYGEVYGSYIIDPTRTMPTGWQAYTVNKDIEAGNYGRNLYTLGNPYTSNIDISSISTDYNVDAVVVYSANNYGGDQVGDYNQFLNDVTKTRVSFLPPTIAPAGVTVGDPIHYIRPYQTFVVRTKDGHGLDFTFNDNMKVFNVDETKVVTFAKGNSKTNLDFYQVGLDLYKGANNTGNRMYVVASDYYQPKGEGNYEAYNTWSSEKDVALYSIQENGDGSIAEDLSDQKVYINGVNATDYVAKPIHVVFQGKDNAPYTFKVRLNDALLNSKNTFYFEDKKEGKVMEITPDFEYTFVEPTVNRDRFVIYWNGLPQTMAIQDVASSKTQVYKDGVEHKVRFAVEFNRADVYVYDLNGRLISVEKSIDTSVDYVLPHLSKGSVFVVKVVGDNGDVTTQKIIK